MRLIDADELIDDCKKYLNSLNSSWYGKECTRIHWLIGILSSAPTIEPERKKGEWIEDGYNHYKAVCSKCGEPCGTYVMGKPRDRFCKWCGADMREEGEQR